MKNLNSYYWKHCPVCNHIDIEFVAELSDYPIYLAGWDVFSKNAKEIGEEYKKILSEYGLRGIFPLDDNIDKTGKTKKQLSKEYYQSNTNSIKNSVGVIANLSPFRGPSADAGTVWEVGYAIGKGIPVVGWNVSTEYKIKCQRFQSRLKNCIESYDYTDLEIEDFGNFDNLMIAESVDSVCLNLKDAAKRMKEILIKL